MSDSAASRERARSGPGYHGPVPEPGPRVDVHDLRVRFGDVEAVSGLTLAVEPGTAVALVGRNGAGKSTSLKVLAGVLPASSGRVVVDGIDVRSRPQDAAAAVGYCPDVGGLLPRATPWEHLQLAARMRRMDPSWPRRASDLLERFDLASVAHRVTAGFSHGMGRRMSVALATFHRPGVLLLDEPFDGVDPLGVDVTLEVIEDLRSCGSAVLVSTHLLELAVRCCSEAVVLRSGRVVSTSPARALAGPGGAARYRVLLTETG